VRWCACHLTAHSAKKIKKKDAPAAKAVLERVTVLRELVDKDKLLRDGANADCMALSNDIDLFMKLFVTD
jgi:hypothetical protein